MSKKSLGFSKSSHIHFGSIENNKDASLQPQYDFKSNNDLVLDNGGDKLFTAKLPVDVVTAQKKAVQFSFAPGADFAEGNYTIQIYQNGFMIGEGIRELKKGGLFS